MPDNHHHLSSTPIESDADDFTRLYENRLTEGVIEYRNKLVFLLSLLAFLNEYKQLEKQLDTFVTESSPDQQRALRLSIILWHYRKIYIP